MKLKPIVASLALLVTGSAFAAYHEAPEPAKVERLQSKLDRNQNPYYAESDWFKRITLSGLVQVYAMGTTNSPWSVSPGNTPFGYYYSGQGLGVTGTPEISASDLWLSRANIYLDADVNDWTEVHIALDLDNALLIESNQRGATHLYSQFDERRYVSSANINAFALPDEAYITIGNFEKSQFYFRGGREYLRFGNYERNKTPATFTQLLTQTQADAAEVGFVDISGFNGALYVFRSTSPGFDVGGLGAAVETENHINNFGAQLGYVWQNGDVTADFTADWLFDWSAVNYLAANRGSCGGIGSGPGGCLATPPYSRRVGGLSFTAKVNYNQFDFMGQYASADQTFNAVDVSFNGTGAFPIAWMVGGGYRFGIMNNDDSRLGVNFQMTHEALAFDLPEFRVQGDFTMEVWKNTEVGLSLIYDNDYNTSDTGKTNVGATNNGSNHDSFTGVLGLTAKFA